MPRLQLANRSFLVGRWALVVLTIFVTALPAAAQESKPPYQRAELPIEERIRDLVGRMTVEEKARQLDMYFGCRDLMHKDQIRDHIHANPDATFDPQLAEKVLGKLGAGAIHDLYPSPELYNTVQKWVIASNRLGIPALFTAEGLHGYMDYGQTVFPQSIGLATTWNPELAKETGAAIAAEARANGIGMLLSPVLDVARDPRWGRVEENFGEDPFLTGKFGIAYVEGMQGQTLASDNSVVATPKHFAGHGSPESGLNTSPVHIGEREMRSVMLKSFEPAIRNGKAMAVMVAYHDTDGVPCAADHWLLTTVLRDEWGFQGFVVADLGAIKRLYDTHHVADSPRDAVCLAINAGVDMQFYDFDHKIFQESIVQGVNEGQILPQVLDEAVSRVLRVKFLLGLFDRPYVDPALAQRVAHSPANRELALDVARQSMCLLKNEGNLLPLEKNLARIAVIGPNANITRFGDYAVAAKENSADGMLEQVKQLVSPKTQVLFATGEKVDEAVAAARQSDVVILGLGEWTGISGEWSDRSELGLPGSQQALLEAVAETGKPTVVVLQNGRPLAIPWAAKHVTAILEAWYPGESGGRAIAETLFGDNNPAGRLTISFPRRIGQLPVYYNHFPSKGDEYVDGDDTPQFPFGHGLSYTTFKYDQLAVTPSAAGSQDDVIVTFEVTNTGPIAGDEVAQLYVRKKTATVATPVRALKGFSRVHLAPGETKLISLPLKQTDLAIWAADRRWNVEPGEYEVNVGGSSMGGMSAKFVLETLPQTAGE